MSKQERKHYNLDEVESTSAEITLGGKKYQVRAHADLPFAKVLQLKDLYDEIEKDKDILKDEGGWDKVKKQIFLLIPDLPEDEWEKHFTIRKATEFLKWHASLSGEVAAEKNGSGPSE